MFEREERNDLLELVDACSSYKYSTDPDDDIRLLKAQELRELGFISKADELEKDLNLKIKLSRISNENYISITDKMIQAFLNKKVERYNDKHSPKLKAKPDDDSYLADTTRIHDSIRQASQAFLEERYRDALQSGSSYMQQYWGTPEGAITNPYQEFTDAAREWDYQHRITEIRRAQARAQQNMQNDPSSMAAQALRQKAMEEQIQAMRQMSGGITGLLGEFQRRWDMPTPIFGAIANGWNGFFAKTCDFMSTKEGTIGKFTWEEIKISEYKTIPPADVLEVLREHKNKELFDYFTIASVNAVKDPLLLGRIEGISERFFISQWGEDVCLDDIL